MPELPEVELVRRRLERSVLDRRIEKVTVLDLKRLDGTTLNQLQEGLVGKEFVKASRIGKQLFLETGNGVMAVHLGLTGDVVVGRVGEDEPRFARLLVDLEDGSRLVFEDMRRFGRIGFARDVDEIIERKGIGPDVMTVSSLRFADKVRRYRRAIKSVLLDQSVFSGVGNLYADEALFQAGIHPLAQASSLDVEEARKLHRDIKRVMSRSLSVESDFDALPKTYLLRNRREGEKCPGIPGARLKVIVVGGRTTVFCPAKQRLKQGKRG
ncbi:MAG TPA: DNA-formamidopyrimidine glycosylase family protein [Methanomassiliicoccales archaeon]|nr:DNA-formamidopyrimidine glycosylase family protein [Methanomassiliicoccales archaeon]